MEYLLLALPALVPLGAFVLVRLLKPRAVWLQLAASTLVGAGTCAFFASAAAAMASAVDPDEALLRGTLIGIGLGLVVGLVALGAIRLAKTAFGAKA